VVRQAASPLDDQHFAIVVTFQGERIARADSYLDPKEALKAAGLSE
jgi:ketosteroid isomerase-like protein